MKRPVHISTEDSGEPAAGEKTREVRIVRKLTNEIVRRTQQAIREERQERVIRTTVM